MKSMSTVDAVVTVVTVTDAAQMAEALAVRRTVFIQEQGVPEELEIDEHDGDPAQVRSAIHVLAMAGGRAVGTGRLLLDDPPAGTAHIGRIAVLSEYRGRGVGQAIMHALHDLARQRGYSAIALNAQTHAIAFYERLGYQAQGEEFLEAGIPHRHMTLRL